MIMCGSSQNLKWQIRKLMNTHSHWQKKSNPCLLAEYKSKFIIVKFQRLQRNTFWKSTHFIESINQTNSHVKWFQESVFHLTSSANLAKGLKRNTHFDRSDQWKYREYTMPYPSSVLRAIYALHLFEQSWWTDYERKVCRRHYPSQLEQAFNTQLNVNANRKEWKTSVQFNLSSFHICRFTIQMCFCTIDDAFNWQAYNTPDMNTKRRRHWTMTHGRGREKTHHTHKFSEMKWSDE